MAYERRSWSQITNERPIGEFRVNTVGLLLWHTIRQYFLEHKSELNYLIIQNKSILVIFFHWWNIHIGIINLGLKLNLNFYFVIHYNARRFLVLRLILSDESMLDSNNNVA